MSISTEEKDRYLRETAIVLAREGFQTGKTDTGKLRVLLDGAPLCEVTENGGITYRNEDIIVMKWSAFSPAQALKVPTIRPITDKISSTGKLIPMEYLAPYSSLDKVHLPN
ncbi:MAG: hypothetical protein BHV89_03740 [Clostridiales bacterium 41_21_two_genomes]|nr:MAG: hypothetical protein BHV89_03740 [Clostridiales bacterium 41_21_two_genomes]